MADPTNPSLAPAPLPPTVALNPPMVGLASPFDRVDGQNRDLILEAIRAWARGPLMAWASQWGTWGSDLVTAVIENSVDLQDPVMAGIIEALDSDTREALNALYLRSEEVKRVVALTVSEFDAITEDPGTVYVTRGDVKRAITSDSFEFGDIFASRPTDIFAGGSPFLWTDSPNLEIVGGKVRASSSTFPGAVGITMPTPDVTVSATLTDVPTAAGIGLILLGRWQGTNAPNTGKGYALFTYPGYVEARILGDTGPVDVAPYPSAVIARGDTLTMNFYGNRVDFAVNGVVFHTLTGLILDSGKVAIGRYGSTGTGITGGTFDDILITESVGGL